MIARCTHKQRNIYMYVCMYVDICECLAIVLKTSRVIFLVQRTRASQPQISTTFTYTYAGANVRTYVFMCACLYVSNCVVRVIRLLNDELTWHNPLVSKYSTYNCSNKYVYTNTYILNIIHTSIYWLKNFTEFCRIIVMILNETAQLRSYHVKYNKNKNSNNKKSMYVVTYISTTKWHWSKFYQRRTFSKK